MVCILIIIINAAMQAYTIVYTNRFILLSQIILNQEVLAMTERDKDE